MTVRQMADATGFQAAAMPDGDRPITGVYIGDLLSWVMGRTQSGDAWITIMSHSNIIAVAALSDAACIVLAEGVSPDDGVVALAEQKGINLLVSPKSAYETALALHKCL